VPDPIGFASARLFAEGVERQQRLLCLRFLGVLLESADAEGHVHCDPDDLAGLGLLQGMTVEEVTLSRILLETFGILDREPTGWSIKQFAPVGDEVPPAAVMAAIGRVLAKPADDAPASTPTPTPAPAAAPPPAAAQVVPMETARTRLARRWMAAPVGAAAAAAVALVALMVSGQVRVPLTASPASNAKQSAVAAGVSPTSTVPGASGPSASAAPSPSTSPTASPSVAPPLSGPPALGTQPPTPILCPVGSVSTTVDHMGQDFGTATPSSINISLPPFVRTSVDGAVHNNSPAGVVVNPFTVTVNFSDPSGQAQQTVTATALGGPTPIAPGASLPWSVTVNNPKDAPVPGTANAAPPSWRWDDASLATACTH